MAALQPPGRAVHPLCLDVYRHRSTGQHHHFRPQPSTLAACAARVGPQGMALDQDGILGFKLLTGAVVRISVVGTHDATHAVLIVFGSPSTAGGAEKTNIELTVFWRYAVEHGDHEVGMVRCNGALGNGLHHGLENRVNHCHRESHPPAHCRRLDGADDSTFGKDDI